MNIAYDGEIFNTWAELAAYCAEKFGETWSANYTHLENYGCDLNGQEMFMNGTVWAGRTRMSLDALGLGSQSDAVQALTNNAQQSYNSWAEVASTRSTETATIAGSQYTNTAMQLGTEEAQGGQVLIATKPTVTSNGTVLNQPNITAVKETADPTVPGTFSYLATLKALGWLPLPTWTAAVAPLLGVTLGVGLYDLNPQLWNKISRTLLPFCYDDNGTPKMPISVDSDGTVHTPEDAIEALRQLFIEEGVYEDIDIDFPEHETSGSVVITSVGSIKSALEYMIAKNNRGITFASGVYEGILSAIEPYEGVNPAIITTFDAQVSFLGWSPLTISIFTNNTVDDTISIGVATPTSLHISTYGNGNDPSQPINITRYQTSTESEIYNIGEWQLDSDYSCSTINTTQSGSDVPGTELQPGAKYPSDGTKHIKDEFPDWYDDGIDVLSNPAKTLFEEGVEKWLPLALSNTNYSDNTDDSYSTKNQTDSQSGENTDDNQIEQIIESLRDLTQTLTENATLPENPTIPSDPSGNTPTPIPPVITGAGSDLIAIYNPTKAQLQEFNQFLWSLDPTNLTNWKKVFVNPIEAVIALQMIYVTPVTGETRNIKCGYIETDVPSKIVTNQYTEIDCGSVDVSEYFHNVWDYIGTRIEIYLPFIGIVPLNVSDIMNSTIRLRYRVDVYTGTCLAQITVYKGNSFGTLYTFPGNCAVQLPITSGQFGALWGAMIGAIGIGIGGVVAGIPGAGMMADNYAASKLMNSGGAAMQRSGHIGANAGALGIRTPYLIITRKIPLDAHLYQTQYGFPANKTVTLGSLSGYTRVKDIHLSGIPCTDDELEQIESLLKDGVIIN